MNRIKVIRNCFAILVTTFTLIYITVQSFNIPNYQENEVNRILDELTPVLVMDKLEDYQIENISDESVVLILVKRPNLPQIPVIYDCSFFPNGTESIMDKLNESKSKLRSYQRTAGTLRYTVWMRKFPVYYQIKYLLIPILVSVLIFIIGLIFIIIFFYPAKTPVIPKRNGKKEIILKKQEDDEELNIEEDDRYLRDELRTVSEKKHDTEDSLWQEEDSEDEIEVNEETEEETNELDAYREIWTRDFKISDDFTEKFPLLLMYRLFRFGFTPEQYILKGLQIGTHYFGWENAGIYISQKDDFINIKTGKKLNIESLRIISSPQMHGVVHIPLYPYSKTNLFGFFEFTWIKNENLVMSDILYFLKILFSNEIKPIFTNQKNNESLKERLSDMLNTNKNVTLAFLEADNRYKLFEELSEDEANILNMKISDDIMQAFSGYVVFEVFPFIYGLCENSKEEDTIYKLKNFLADKDKHNYFISPSRGNVAVTFSIGLSSKKERDIDIQKLIDEAENELDNALDCGGNRVSIFGENR
ncbi:MAG: hypothetical protein J1G30_00765 [Spirochaetales bacterium]|nr:hypothetical protein [Spirochaetales bacterium]